MQRKAEFTLFNRTLQTLVVHTHGGVDDYGYQLAEELSTRKIEGSVSLYQHTQTSDIRYIDCEYVVLTKDKDISVNDSIEINGKEMKVMFVNPYGRLKQVFIK